MKKIYFVILFLFMSFPLAAQPRWVNLTFTNHVTAIERIGTSWWIGTTGGLVKYDTVDRSITVFNCANSNLPADHINDLTVDEQGRLWIATKNGLSWYKDHQFTDSYPLYSKNILLAKYEKGKGLWVATDTSLSFYASYPWKHYFKDDQGNKLENLSAILPVSPNGVIYANGSQVKMLRHNGDFSDFSYPGNSVTGLAYDGMNQLYVSQGSTTGGFYVQTSQWDFYNRDNSPLPDNQIFALKNDAKYNIYFLHPHGFSMKTASGNYWSIETAAVDSRLDGLFTTAIYPDSLGALGLANGFLPYTFTESYDGGYSSRFNFGKMVNLNKTALKTNEVLRVAFAHGKKYIGTYGISVWDKNNQQIKEYHDGSMAISNPIGALEVDIFGRIWWAGITNRMMGSPNKFAVIDHDKVTEFDNETFLGSPIDGIESIQWETTHVSSTDTSGNLWISYWGKHSGIAWYDGKSWNTFPDTTQNRPSGFTQFVNDRNGIKWFATMMGIYSYDGKRFTSYWGIAPIHQATCVALDKQGNLWFGGKPDEQLGWKGGLAKFDGSTWILYDKGNSLIPDMYVTSIAVDTTGVIWVGTAHGGIFKMKWPHTEVLNEQNSVLDNNTIVQLAVDKQTNDLWVLNWNAGIFIYNEKGIATGVHSLRKPDISSIKLQNYPNPFTGFTTLTFTVPKTMRNVPVSLDIYNVVGQKITTLLSGRKVPGDYSVRFHAEGLVPGLYFYRLKMGHQMVVKKMVLSR